MQRHHTGSGRRSALPVDWAAMPSQVIGTTLQSKVRIGPAGGGSAWNEGLGQTVTADGAAVYVGPATLMLVSDSARALTMVEDPIKSRVYDVTLPFDNNRPDVLGDPDTVQVGHLITVDTQIIDDGADPDPELPTKPLRVHAIERGTRRFSRVLLAVMVD